MESATATLRSSNVKLEIPKQIMRRALRLSRLLSSAGARAKIELKSENRRKAAEKLKQYLREAKANNNSATYILQLNMQLEVM